MNTDQPNFASAIELAQTSKSIFRSKAFWLQVLTLLCAFVPAIATFIKSNPVEFAAVLGAINVLIRFATQDRVHIFPPDEAPSSSGTRGGSPLLVLLACMATALLGGSLSSCSAFEPGTKVTTSIFYRDANGAKAGLSVTGVPKAAVVPTK